MGDDNEWKKASTEEKVEHKNWKARLEGYEECCKLFRLADDPKSPIYLNYLGLVKKFVVDSNEVAKERALEAVLAFVENIPAAAKTVGEVMPGLINKCLNARPKTKDKAIEIIMMYIEVEKQEIVQEELIKGLENKQPKIVQSCIEILRRAINEFSSKTIPIKPIIKFVPKLLEDRDKTVRDETKLLAIEMYRWAGAAIMPQLQGIKPQLLGELEEEFKNAASEKPRQTRFLRSQQDLKAKMEAEAEARMMNGDGAGAGVDHADGGGGEAAEPAESIDPYDLMEPAEILSKLPKDFKEKLEAKKWQERKEVLDTLLGILQKNPRLQITDYYDLVNDLKKIVAKDANINIVVVAAKCITGIAQGVRKDFGKYALMSLEPLMERFKEKKQNVVDALREACDAIYPSTNLEAIQEMCVGYLGHKTPVVRQQVALFLAKCFAMSTQTSLPKKVLKLYLPPLIKNLSEADPSVRDSSSEALGAVYKCLGEKIFMPLVGEVEQIKLDKIKEYAEKTVLLNAKGEPRANQKTAAPAAAPTPAPAAAAAKKPTITKPSEAPKSSAATKPASEAKKEAAPKKVVKGGGGDAKKPAVFEEPDLSQDVVDEKSVELFGAECINGLANSNWKERQSAIENLANQIKRFPTDEVPVQIVVRTVAKKPGFKDAHFQVLKQRLELICAVADTGFKFSQRSASYCLADIADKIGDAKTSQQAKDALSKISEQCTLGYVCTQIIPSIFEGKNPKNQEHVLLWAAQAIKEFGFTGVDMKFLLTHIKSALQNSNVTVRSSAIQLISTIYMYVGPNFRALFDQEKPALLEQIDAEIEKIKSMKPPAPIRGKNVVTAGAQNGDGEAAADEEPDPIKMQLEQEALMPRTDISAQLADSLMDQLNDKNWKERQAALERIEGILRENKFIEPNLNEFPTHLNKRLVDTNKILAGTALKISEKLAQALGTQGKRYVSVLASGMIQALSDNKEALRKTAISALNAWFDNCGGLVPFLEGDLLLESFSTATNPNIKAELCGWLAQVLPKCKVGKLPPELKAIIPHVYAFVEDRNPEVRTKAQELILPLMTHVGPNDMLRVMQKAKPTSITVLQPLIEKARTELAAKQPPPVAKPAPAPAAAPSKAPPSKAKPTSIYDSPDESMEDTPAAPPPAKKIDPKAANANKTTKDTNGTGKTTESAKSSAPSASSKKKGNEDEDLGPVMQVSHKNKRVDEEKALKTLKWNFDVPRKEFIDQLKQQMETAGFNRTLMVQLFHDDFKFHITALQTLTKCIDDASDATLSNLDLILRWLTLRFFETNPTVILKAIEYMQALFSMLLNVKNYHLLDYEANAFIPYFIGKLGDPKDPIRKGFRQIIKQIAQVYAPVKIFNYLVQGLASKNARQRAECLEELGQMIEALGLNPFNPSVTLKEIAKQIGDRDNSVRNAALNTITISYQIAGDQVYKFIGKLNEKDQSMLDERIKRSSKAAPNGGVKSSASGPLNQANPYQQMNQMPNSASMSSIASSANQQSNLNGHHPASASSISSSATQNGVDEPKASIPNGRSSSRTTPKKGVQSQTQTIVPNVASMQPAAPKQKGEFSLDLKDDDDDKDSVIPIKLTPHQDLDELLNQPIGLPPPRKNITNYPINILKESQDCKEAIDLVITHISHQKIDISVQNLVQIDVVIKDRDKKDLLIPHIDNLLNTCAVKLNVAHNVYLNSQDCQVDEIFKLFKSLFSVIIDIFESELGKHTSTKTLKDVFYNLLCVMTDTKILNYPDGDQLIKAINIVTLKLLELSDQTTSYCALVKLLSECCNDENFSSKYLELVMKCIWRQIRRLSSSNTNPAAQQAFENLMQQIDTSKVFSEIHTFLKMYPSSSWQSKSSDLPLRTVKTLLFHLAKAKQSQVLDDLNKIRVPDDSEIKIYIMKLFKNGFQLSNNNTSSNITGNSSFGFGGPAKGSMKQENLSPDLIKGTSPSVATRELGDQLSAIIKKIGNSETSKEGLAELYEFKQKNPNIELNKYFKNSSGKLQAYIQENLKLIEQERNGTDKYLTSDLSSNGPLFAKNIVNNKSPERTNGSEFKTEFKQSTNLNRNVDDIMKTIADWKSKTHLNKLDDEDNDENNIRSPTSGLNGDYKFTNSNTNRLFELYKSNGNSKSNSNGNGNGNYVLESENSIKAEKYLDIVKDLKKKYTRSRTEPLHMFKNNNPHIIISQADDESDQLNDLKQLDFKAKNLNENSASNSNLTQIHHQTHSSNGDLSTNANNATTAQSDNLYDEYKRRLELIKKTKPVQ